MRYLHLDTPWVQGAMFVRAPGVIVLEYVQRMMAWMLWRPTADLPHGHAVQLGLGAGSITRFCHRELQMDRVTAVEFNPAVIAACRHGFKLPPDDARLTVVEADAAAWVADAANRGCGQVLCVDLYDDEAAAPVLDSAAFYGQCRDVLAAGGLMSVNLFGRASSFERSVARIAASFGDDQVWSLQPTREGNTVVVAARGVRVPSREELIARATVIEQRHGLPARKWLRMVRPYGGASAL
ncbi:MAG: spermidine synthase [Aquincola sp.]|nr:spermidine synthase [Aquincola sp.]